MEGKALVNFGHIGEVADGSEVQCIEAVKLRETGTGVDKSQALDVGCEPSWARSSASGSRSRRMKSWSARLW